MSQFVSKVLPATAKPLIVVAMWATAAGLAGVAADAAPPPNCQYEDGNPDGNPCVWTNDGQSFYVTSENYR